MLKIYGVPVSVHTRKAIVVAIAKELPHEIVTVVPVVPESTPPNWRELSPCGVIPVLVDGDFVLSDSAAICAYLDRLSGDPVLYPQDLRAYAQALSLEQYAGYLFRKVVHPLFNEVFVQPNIHKKATDQKAVDAVLSGVVPEIFGYLDRIVGQIVGENYLVNSAFSIADISIVSNLITYQYIGFDLYRQQYPNLASYFDRVIQHPAMSEALRRERPVAESMGLKL